MRKILYILTIFMLVSCSGNKQDSSEQMESSDSTEIIDTTQEVAEVESVITEPEENAETGYTAPVTVKCSVEPAYGDKRKLHFTIELLKNGRVKGNCLTQQWDVWSRSWADPDNEDPNLRGKNTELSGKWSTTSIPFGDGYMTVFAIDTDFFTETMYMPNDCEYIWMCKNAYWECENWNTKLAVEISEVIKP